MLQDSSQRRNHLSR